MVADKDLPPLPGLIKCNILSGGSHPRLLSADPSGAGPAHAATEFRDRNRLKCLIAASQMITVKRSSIVYIRLYETDGVHP